MTGIVTLGADPEVFFQKDGMPEMAIGLVGGTKKDPRPLGIGAVQEDNVAAEYNIPPCSSEDEWVAAHTEMLNHLSEIAGGKGLQLAIQPIMNFSQEQLMSEPAAMILGCEPEESIYQGFVESPNPYQPLRTAGAHIHVGVEEAYEDPQKFVRSMDVFLGVPASVYDKDWEERSKMYGGFGKYRTKDYGVEYRALSNFWLQSEELMRWAYRSTMKAIEKADEVAQSGLNIWSRKDELELIGVEYL